MFYKKIIFYIFALYPSYNFACSAPFHGEEYDAYIFIEDIETEEMKNTNTLVQKFKFPYKIKGPFNDNEKIIFRDASIFIEGENYAHTVIPVKVSEKNGNMVGEIYHVKDIDRHVELSVTWYNDDSPCSVQGRKILKHNKSLKHGTPPVGGAP
jgi:hypothetical protein